jgi:hypothetical protein
MDENGNQYYVPNFCINDPYFEKEFNETKVENADKMVKVCA